MLACQRQTMYTFKSYVSLFTFLLTTLTIPPAQAFQQGEPVVNFALTNLDNGDIVTPEQYKGKILVLFFVGFN